MVIRILLLFAISFLAINEAAAAKKPVSFSESMKRSKYFSRSYSKVSSTWRLYRKLYFTYKKRKKGSCHEYRIPRIIHFIWFGSPLPERFKPLIASWKKHHPTWEIKIWTDKDVHSFPFPYDTERAFKQARNFGEKSDIFRLIVLYYIGGLYLDVDFECLSPFDNLHKACGFYTGIGYDKKALLFNGLIGSRRKHPVIKECLKRIKPGPGDHQRDRILRQTGPQFFTQCFYKCKKRLIGDAITFPVTYFYPFPHSAYRPSQRMIIRNQWVRPESMAIHYWACSWMR